MVGRKAAEVLTLERPFTIRGVTSRGIFVDIEEKIILFLSRERFRGPLIINLPQNSDILDKIQVKTVGMVCRSSLLFSSPDLAVHTAKSLTWSALDVWKPIVIPESLPTNGQIFNFFQQLNSRNENGNELIDMVSQILKGSTSPLESANDMANAISTLYHALRQKDIGQLDRAALFLAGRGRGLTPSGDDFLLGICYGMFIAQVKLSGFHDSASKLISGIVAKRSTLISGNLVECAAAGEVDERLGTAFHALLHPEQSSSPAIDGILSWGSSSGMDAAAGMALLLSAIR